MIMSSKACIPPGFRFHPTDEELVGYYLRKKIISSSDQDMIHQLDHVIRDIDLYKIEPWDLQDKCWIGYEEQNEWYFFSYKDKKYPTGRRRNRATMTGFWKATGRDKAVYDKSRLITIGMRKTLVFYKGRAPNGQKTDWIMHEYRLNQFHHENIPPPPTPILQEEGWVVCRAFKKRTTRLCKSRTSSNVEHCDSPYLFEESSSSNIMLFCNNKEVIGVDNFYNCIQLYDNHDFVEIPSINPLPKTKSRAMIHIEEDYNQIKEFINVDDNYVNRLTNWQALDKFVASQLNHEDKQYHDLRSMQEANLD